MFTLLYSTQSSVTRAHIQRCTDCEN